jgi:3-oxoacyl-[acyl-carrier protein] reductase
MDFKNKRAVVCGASQGIGRATAFALAEAGAEVILLSRNEDSLKTLCDQLPADHGQTHSYISVDFTHPDRAATKLKEKLNPSQPIHILINNAGGPPSGTIMDSNLGDFADAFTVHLLTNQAMVKTLVPGMKEARYGRIINVISTSVKQPIPNLGVSNTIRGAVANWSKTLAGELGPYGITVNNVLPGFTKTGRLEEIIDNKSTAAGVPPDQMMERMYAEVPAKRFADPSEIAACIRFLASDEAGYVNGVNLPVDGGRTSCL